MLFIVFLCNIIRFTSDTEKKKINYTHLETDFFCVSNNTSLAECLLVVTFLSPRSHLLIDFHLPIDLQISYTFFIVLFKIFFRIGFAHF